MDDSLKAEMDRLYLAEVDPWRYSLASRHAVTVMMVQKFWGGGTILEPACAEGRTTGLLSQYLLPKPDGYVAFDLSELALTRAMDSCRGVGVKFMRGDLRELCASDYEKWALRVSGYKRYDLILVSDVLGYIPELANFLLEIFYGLLRLGGYLISTAWVQTDGKCILGKLVGQEPILVKAWKGTSVDLKGVESPAYAKYNVYRKL